MPLAPEHPDHDRKPGDKITVDGREWTFGANQYSSFWRAKQAGTVTCVAEYPDIEPYVSFGRLFEKFEDAGKRAVKGARDEYDRAKDIVRRYEDI